MADQASNWWGKLDKVWMTNENKPFKSQWKGIFNTVFVSDRNHNTNYVKKYYGQV